jgi:phenylalanyl-tRNA synthetase beta chain
MDDAVGIKNAFNESYTHMRRSLSVRLLENIAANTKHSKSLRFFEISKVYHKTSTSSNSVMADFLTHVDRLPFPEKKILAGVVLGSTVEELRSDIEVYLNMILGYVPPLHQDSGSVLACLHPGVSASYRVGDVTVARFGRVHPETAETYDIPAETLYVEFEYEELLALMTDRESPFTTISRFQRIDRELNFVMTESVRTGEIATTISALHPWIRDIMVDSIFRDESKIGTNKKSVNFAFSLQSDESTISDDEAMGIQNMIIDKMAEQGIAIR